MEVEREVPQTESGSQAVDSQPRSESFVAPRVPIVRSNTSRPRSLGRGQREPVQTSTQGRESSITFPTEAPTAPPLPEEDIAPQGESDVQVVESTPLPLGDTTPEKMAGDYLWVFEYGLQMDPSAWQNQEHQEQLVLPYGPASLKGYQLAFDALDVKQGQIVATIIPGHTQEAEVWGCLYRAPQRFARGSNNQPAFLDKAHRAIQPDKVFEPLQVVVQDTYRKREIQALTYVASAPAHERFRQLPVEEQLVDPGYVQRLLEVGRKQQLPDEYLQNLAALVSARENAVPVSQPLPSKIEQNTEPLPVVANATDVTASPLPEAVVREQRYSTRWMMILAIYFAVVFSAVLTLAVIQGLGYGKEIFNAGFTPLGLPWFVLVYGVIGGSISSMRSLGRARSTYLPGFVLFTWFTRPYIGAVLAGLAYLLLTSSLFVPGGSIAQQNALFSLIGVVAGFCEGWLFHEKA